MTDQDPPPLGSHELADLRALLHRAARSTTNPSWQRTLNEAAHVTSLLAEPPAADVDELRRRLAAIRAELEQRAETRAAAVEQADAGDQAETEDDPRP